MSGYLPDIEGTTELHFWIGDPNPSSPYYNANAIQLVNNAGGLALTKADGVTNLFTIDPSGNVVFSGSGQFAELGVGVAAQTNVGVNVGAALSGNTNQYGAAFAPTFSSGATGLGVGVYTSPTTLAASFTLGTMVGVYIDTGTKGAGSTITIQYGLYIASQALGATNYAIQTNGGIVEFNSGWAHFYYNNTSAPPAVSGGLLVGWNGFSGSIGETDFINNHGGGNGGFYWWDTGSASFGNLIAKLNQNGKLQIQEGLATSSYAAVGGTIFDHFADANGGTSETDMYTDTIPASALGTNGDTLRAVYYGIYAATGNNKTIKVYFAGTVIMTGTTVATSGSMWWIEVWVVRKDTATVRCMVKAEWGTGTSPQTAYTEVGSLTLTNSQILKITGTSPTSASDITAKAAKVLWKSAA